MFRGNLEAIRYAPVGGAPGSVSFRAERTISSSGCWLPVFFNFTAHLEIPVPATVSATVLQLALIPLKTVSLVSVESNAMRIGLLLRLGQRAGLSVFGIQQRNDFICQR